MSTASNPIVVDDEQARAQQVYSKALTTYIYSHFNYWCPGQETIDLICDEVESYAGNGTNDPVSGMFMLGDAAPSWLRKLIRKKGKRNRPDDFESIAAGISGLENLDPNTNTA
jgi:hypothetical protein